MLLDPIFMECPEQMTHTQIESRLVVTRHCGREKWVVTASRIRVCFGVMKMFWNKTEMVTAQHSECMKCY